MVANDVDSVAVTKEGAEAIAHGDLDLVAESQIVVAWQPGDELPPPLPGTGLLPTGVPVLDEHVAEARIFLQPEPFSVLLVPRFDVLLLVLGSVAGRPPRIAEIAHGRLPFPAAVEQIAEEEDRVGLQLGSQLSVALAQVVVCDEHGEL
ncbi:hypothetical protein HYQ46_010878 [Verticillium longisporum]|nr:hypothetical protein HYQ46_010878 [Verticillium longisporum]